LVQLLDAFGQTEANDGADVGLVDAEAEGDGADQNADFFGHPLFLIFAAGRAIHLAVIADGGDAVFFKEVDNFADAGDRGRIDDDVAVRRVFYGGEHHGVLEIAVALFDEIAKVFAMEAGNGFEGIAQFELADYVVPDALGGTGGESGDGHHGEKFTEFF
jgi:hypothetical protein